jgi:dipeptidyl-peptidase-4
VLRRVSLILVVMSSASLSAADDRNPTGAATSASRTDESPIDIRVANEKFLRQYAETYRFSLGRPQRARITPDGKAVLFLRSLPRSFVMDLFAFDCQTGQERVLLTAEKILAGKAEKLSAEEQAQRERLRLAARGIARYDLSEDGNTILVPLSGRLFVVDRLSGDSREVKSSSSAFPLDATLSPDAKQLACVRGGELLVTDLASGSEQQLTHTASGTITNGTAEFVAQEEMDRHRGFWWSPDSRSIAYQQTDTAGMETFHISDLAHPEAEPHVWPYPRAGGKNARVRLGIIAAKGGETTWIDWNHEKYPYLAHVTWDENCPLTILVQNRLQTEEVLYAVDPQTGTVRQLLVETDPAWLNLVPDCPRWLRDGSGFLWLTERSGEWQLELRAPKGDLVRTLTPPGLGLATLADVRETSRMAYVTAGDDPTQSHLYAVSLDGGEPRRLTREPGFQHALIAARDEPRFVFQYDLADGESGTRVVDDNWRRIGELESRAEVPLIRPQFELLQVGERQFHASLVRPQTFDKAKKYPVILDVYGGPRHLSVGGSPRFYYLDQWLADQGFVVVSLDGRGTPRRGREWERAIRGNLIDIPLQDQVDGLQALGRKYAELDLSRVGVTGWSFGGYFSAMAAMRRPDVFKCAVAGAPVCDFRDYDTHYTERYLGLPQDNPRGYDESNVLTYCPALSVPLLIIHGTADDNVYFLHSLKMTEALFRAGKQFDFLPLAGFTHMVPDPQVTIRLQSRLARFFQDHLGSPVPQK